MCNLLHRAMLKWFTELKGHILCIWNVTILLCTSKKSLQMKVLCMMNSSSNSSTIYQQQQQEQKKSQ